MTAYCSPEAVADAVAYDDMPRYEKRRRPPRSSSKPAVRRALNMAYRSGSPASTLPTGGFHRRYIKKPLHAMG
jgi:hypothetical protein